jgi:hypothetical protein
MLPVKAVIIKMNIDVAVAVWTGNFKNRLMPAHKKSSAYPEKA